MGSKSVVPVRCLLTVLLVAMASGCSDLDLGAAAETPSWRELSADRQDSEAHRRQQRMARVLSAWRSQRGRQTDRTYRLGRDDVLAISVFALETPGTTTRLERTVDQDGRIALPWIGTVRAGGLTVSEVERSIRDAYAGAYLKEPQVMVNVQKHRSATVVVTGAVGEPGIYPLPHNRSTVLETLTLAGGLRQDAGDEVLLLRSNGSEDAPGEPDSEAEVVEAGQPDGTEAIPIDLTELIDRGNLVYNLEVRDGDVVCVPAREERYIAVLGYVRKAGVYRLRGSQVDALHALAWAGGLLPTGRAGNCHVIRGSGDGAERVPVDLSEITRGEAPPLYLRGGDTLIVGTNLGGRVSEVLRPTMGASVSASANVAP